MPRLYPTIGGFSRTHSTPPILDILCAVAMAVLDFDL